MKRFDINAGFKKVVQFNLAKRWLVLLFFITITALAFTQVFKLKFDFNPEAMLEFSEEEIAYQQAFDEKFQSNSNVFLLVFSYANSQDISLYNSEALKDLRDLTDIVGNIEGIEGSYSLARVPDNKADNKMAMLSGHLDSIVPEGDFGAEVAEKVKERVSESDLLNGNLISKDGKYAMIMATLAPESIDPNNFYEVYEATAAAVEKWQALDNNSEYKIAYGGLPYIRAEIVDRMKTEQFILWPVVGILYILALCVVFRSLW
ncbi:MAG: MMPL family transporter, partial [Proteobacteria bacterium]|nr:MMPL family transporter [Pseudomonadota bacterium]